MSMDLCAISNSIVIVIVTDEVVTPLAEVRVGEDIAAKASASIASNGSKTPATAGKW